jgi:hypothetical protein
VFFVSFVVKTSEIKHQTSEIRPPVQKQGRPIPNRRSGQAERLRNGKLQSEFSDAKSLCLAPL